MVCRPKPGGGGSSTTARHKGRRRPSRKGSLPWWALFLCLAHQDLQDVPGQSMQGQERCTTATQVSLLGHEAASVNLLEAGYAVESQSQFDLLG